MSVEEFTYLRGRTTRQVKVTLLSAQQAAAYYDPELSKAAYATRDAYLADLVDFTRREIAELARLGCEYIQIDAPQYAALLDETIREGYRQRGSDPDRLLDTCIELDNAIIDGHPGVTFGIHICRGNHKSMFYASGGYDRIAEHIFRRARFQRFLLEYDDERSGTFEPLRHVPDDRVVVLGLVSSKLAQLESAAELERRIAEASRFVPLERLAISPQCGFASTHEGNRLTRRRSAREAGARRPHGPRRVDAGGHALSRRLSCETLRDRLSVLLCVGATRAAAQAPPPSAEACAALVVAAAAGSRADRGQGPARGGGPRARACSRAHRPQGRCPRTAASTR